jgi:uncharacterized protein YceK
MTREDKFWNIAAIISTVIACIIIISSLSGCNTGIRYEHPKQFNPVLYKERIIQVSVDIDGNCRTEDEDWVCQMN